MKKLLIGLFVFSFLFVGSQVHSVIAQENLSIVLESNPSVDINGYANIKLGDSITFTGFPNNLTGQNGVDYTMSFNFDPIFNDVCNQDGIHVLSQKCTPTQTGTGTFYIQITQNGHVYNSNIIRVIVTPKTLPTTITLESNPSVDINGYVNINLGDAITFTGFPNNLTGDITTDYTRSFNFDPIFNDVCNQNGNNGWSQKCIPTQTGTGSFSIQVKQNGKTYDSNVIKVKVVYVNPGAPSITILSPNGGETYTAGQQITVKWKSENLPSDAKIRVILHSPHDLISSFNPSTYYVSNTGSTTFTLPTESDFVKGYPAPWGKNFQFGVSTPNSNSTGALALDLTDDTFTINSVNNVCTNGATNYPTCTITSTLPTGCTSTDGYSPITGKKCSGKDEVKDTGCIAGYNYSSTTGKPCALGLYKKDNTNVINPTNSTVPFTSSFKRTLKRGIKGEDVKLLQLFLNLAADGSFGPQTQQKVIEWQIANGLTPDGAFGIKSATKAGLAD